jgi:hypothetical protein
MLAMNIMESNLDLSFVIASTILRKKYNLQQKIFNFEKKIMLQRIQSLFLIGYVIAILGCCLIFPIDFDLDTKEIKGLVSNLPYLFILLGLISIFLFSKRKVQIILNNILLFSSIGHEILVLNEIYIQFETQQQFFILRFTLALGSWLMLIFANKYIKKDEALIRSLDRLR